MRVYGRETLLKDLAGSPDLLKKRMDADLWDVLFKASGMRTFMDAEARKAFQKSRDTLSVIPLTEDNLRNTFEGLYADRDEMFANGVENLFRKLSWCHKTNSPLAFGKKLIMRVRGYMMTRGIDPESANIVDDLIRALSVLSGKPEPDHRQGAFKVLGDVMNQADRGEWAGEYFTVRWAQERVRTLHFPGCGIGQQVESGTCGTISFCAGQVRIRADLTMCSGRR